MSESLEGYQEIPEADRKKAKVFFDKGIAVAGTGQYDFAIEMFLSGLLLDPDAVEAHQTLRDISLKRKASGGKSIGFMEGMKLKRGTKDDKQNLINNEKLLASDPGSTDYMVGVLQNALRGGYWDTVLWIGPILQKANADSPKPDASKFIVLKDAYKKLRNWKLATDACHYAAMLRPDDMDLQKELKDLGAMHTMDKGNYGTARSFRDSVKDMSSQSKLMIEDKDVRTMDQLSSLIADSEAQWKAEPHDPGKLMKYVETLMKTEQLEYENKAIDLLQEAYDRTKQFRFRQNIGKIRMAQMNRQERSLRQAVQANKDDPQALQDYSQYVQEKLQEEQTEYQLWVENYPTEPNYRYQVGIRLYQLKKYNEAIPVLQQVRQDPKYRTDASVVLARAFLEAGFADEAVDTLAVVVSEYVHKGDAKSIDMTYWYARGLEQKGDIPAAIKQLSQVAQWNFNFKDTQARIKKLRDSQNPPPGT